MTERVPGLRRVKSQPRTFDYAEARRLRWVDGMPVWWIAERFGVSQDAVYYALSAKRRAYKQAHGIKRRASLR